MSNLLYLGIAIALSVAGIVLLWARNRRPTSLESGIEDFQRELKALSPNVRPDQSQRHQAGRPANHEDGRAG